MWIHVNPTERGTLILKIVEREVFLIKPKHRYHLSQWGDVFMVPNHEMKGDYYVNLCLSKSTNEH